MGHGDTLTVQTAARVSTLSALKGGFHNSIGHFSPDALAGGAVFTTVTIETGPENTQQTNTLAGHQLSAKCIIKG